MSIHPFLKQVEETCESLHLLPRGSRILIGASGGPDSTALVYALVSLTEKWNLSLAVTHLNHKARGDRSDKDAQFVEELARFHGLPCTVSEVDVKALATQRSQSFQEAARECRLEIFEGIAKREGYDYIALGHTADDQAETVMMNLLRGAGLRGLGGMAAKRDRIVRPLIHSTREEVEQFLSDSSIEYRTDDSNKNQSYLRNRVRLKLLPELEADYSPNLRVRLSSMAEMLQSDEAFLSQFSREEFQRIQNMTGKSILDSLPAAELLNLPIAIRSRVVREMIVSVKGDLKRIELRHVQEILNLVDSDEPGETILPGNIRVVRSGQFISFKYFDRKGTSGGTPEAEPNETLLNIPGTTLIDAGKFTFCAQLDPSEANPYQCAYPNQAYLDFDRTGDQLLFRYCKPGDRFWPLGAPGTKKLKSFFIDKKIEREKRGQVPLLTNTSGDIIWVYGNQISHCYRVTPETQNILFLEGKG